ncbi:hypothetical protein H5410_010256 [Solanum commersonii]|uniref:LOB domain-containing protein n=1 Tax=Solanum commersonii TaxID=4109 RepID=A0A9J6AK80_SOLCO|nr:hypothetical protein H5410_010256 [Solanum commersonii]
MSSTRCAACKQLRRKYPSDCIFLPYFPPNNSQRFSYVHRIYGASNVGKMLQQVEEHQRGDVADSLYYEAYYRIKILYMVVLELFLFYMKKFVMYNANWLKYKLKLTYSIKMDFILSIPHFTS